MEENVGLQAIKTDFVSGVNLGFSNNDRKDRGYAGTGLVSTLVNLYYLTRFRFFEMTQGSMRSYKPVLESPIADIRFSFFTAPKFTRKSTVARLRGYTDKNSHSF